MKWQNQVVNITTNHKVKIYFTLPEFSATKIVTWDFHVDKSTKSRYAIILGRYLLASLGLYLELFYHYIKGDDRMFERGTAPMVNLGTYEFKNLDTGKITHKEYFTNAYVEKVFES